MSIAIVGGCGHVGLPLALKLLEKLRGEKVTIIDSSSERLDMVCTGRMPFEERDGEKTLIRALHSRRLTVTSHMEEVRPADAVILTTGSGVQPLLSFLRPGQLVIIRNTIGPGGMAAAAERLAGCGVDLAFCPERILQGESLFELGRLPQLIGAEDEQSYQRTRGIFTGLGVDCIRLSFAEAELAKLFTNTWRYITFAAANQFWTIATEHEVNFDRVRDAMQHGYPRAAGLPDAGFAGGPCLPKDAALLGPWPLVSAAFQVNASMPQYLVSLLEAEYTLSEMTVGVLGQTFKPGSDDVRSSPAMALAALLRPVCREVLCTDPHLPDLPSLEEVREKADLLVVGTEHPEYDGIEAVRI